MSSKEQAKREREFGQFVRFAEQMGWPVTADSVIFGKPPAPDILYLGGSEPVAFEIACIVEPEMAKAANTPGISAFFTAPNVVRVFREKLVKSYSTDYPIELLLCHCGALVTDDCVLPELQMEAGAADHVQFRRVWYSGEHGPFLIYPFAAGAISPSVATL